MNRSQIRDLKRAVSERHDKEAASRLLRHSLTWGHKRLMIVRYLTAVLLGIEIEKDVDRRCLQIILDLPSGDLDHMARAAQKILGLPESGLSTMYDSITF